MHEIRPYESDRDRAAVHRVFRDCSWSGSDDDDKRNDIWLIQEHGRTLVGVIDDVPEAVVVTNSGSIRYVDRDLPLAAVSAVVVSRRARRQGLARSATVEALAQEAEAGAAVSLLGIFAMIQFLKWSW